MDQSKFKTNLFVLFRAAILSLYLNFSHETSVIESSLLAGHVRCLECQNIQCFMWRLSWLGWQLANKMQFA